MWDLTPLNSGEVKLILDQALEELCPMPDGRVVMYAMGATDFIEERDNLHCFIHDTLQLNDMKE